MKTRPAARPGSDRDLLALREPVYRVVRARVVDPDLVDELVQETLARIWEVRWRLERHALAAYAVTVARNLVTSNQRAAAVHRRHAPRMALHPVAEETPEQAVLEAEDRAALAAALSRLSSADRDLLVAHEVENAGVDKLAAERGITLGALTARLARARARLRVEYLLVLRGTRLPTQRCRPVLDALSLGDRRRQADLGAGEHLGECPTCAALAPPLIERRRSLAWLAPLAWLVALAGWLRHRLQQHPAQSAAVISVVAVAAVIGLVVVMRPDPSPPPPAAAPSGPASTANPARAQPPGTLVASGQRVLPDAADTLQRYIGQRATAVSVPVDAVPADEGFWIGTTPGHRSWVQLTTRTESQQQIRPGMQVSFSGRVEPVPPGWPARIGLTEAEGAPELVAIGAYVAVDPADLVPR